MRADILRQLIQAHAAGDNAAFRKAALQLAAAESAAGHTKIADDLRRQVADLPSGRARGVVVDIAQPRGDLAETLEGGHRDERLRDIVLDDSAQAELNRVIKENRARASLERHGIEPRRKPLFHGPPGCGKTLAAKVLAGEMGLPLLTVRLASLFSRFLGATANHLRAVFAEMTRRPGVYLFDEFDSVAGARRQQRRRRAAPRRHRVPPAHRHRREPEPHRRRDEPPRAARSRVFRGFDVVVPFELPSEELLADLVHLRLRPQGIDLEKARSVARLGVGLSYADSARACDDAIRTMVLDGRDDLALDDVVSAFEAARRRGDEQERDQGRRASPLGAFEPGY